MQLLGFISKLPIKTLSYKFPEKKQNPDVVMSKSV